MHFVQGKSNDDCVEEDFIDSLNTFFKGDFLFKLFHFLFFGRLYNFPVDPMLNAGISAAECHKKTVEKRELFLLVFFLGKG